MEPLDANAEQPSGIQLLLTRVFAVAEQWGHVDVLCDENDVRLGLTPAPGLRTFLSVTRQLSVLTDLYKVECSTLVGNIEYAADDLIDSIDAADATTSGGVWEIYSDGDVGVTGHLLVADPSSPRLAELVDRLLALQIEHAIAVGAPGWQGFAEQRQPTRPLLRLTSNSGHDRANSGHDRATSGHDRATSGHDRAYPGPDLVESVDDDWATLVARAAGRHPSALRRVP
jgi:hypothetical protein